MSNLIIKNLYKSYISSNGEEKKVLSNINLGIGKSALLPLLGKSGCGKTSLLRIIAGYEKADSGSIILSGKQLAAPSRDRFMVFQSFNQLFPWKSVKDNIVFALLKSRKDMQKYRASELADFWLKETELTSAAALFPAELSGGMKQRAAIARAFAVEPALLLLDEPFSGLDARLRESAQNMLISLCKKHETSALFVTHDITEARRLSSEIAIMRADGSEIIKSDSSNNDFFLNLLK